MRPLFCIATLVLICPASAASADDGVIDRIIAAWKAREQRFQTGRIEFENADTYPAGTLIGPKESPIPTAQTFVLKHEFVFDGQKGRYTRSGEMFDIDLRRMAQKEYVATFDGRYSESMFEGEKQGDHPAGYVEDIGSLQGNCWDWHVDPVIVGVRPLTEQLNGLDPRGWGNPIRTAVIDGMEVLVFRERSYEFSVDPAREYLLVRRDLFRRAEGARPERLVYRLDYRYDLDNTWGWVPASWRLVEIGERSRTVTMTIEGRVTSRVFNEPVAADEFHVDFPRGTIVYHGPEDRIAIVRDDGRLRTIDPGETRNGVTYAEMMATDPPSVIAQRRRYWLFGFIFLAAAASGALVFYWRLR